MQKYVISLLGTKEKTIFELSDRFRGQDEKGNEISFTNYYMQLNGKPFFGVSGEFHFSRCAPEYWEDEIIKMKMAGINMISTYVFWIHHEEEKGKFRFDGRRNLRKFVELCGKHNLYVIVRIGPFDHGEARNGGYPDWMYGMDFEPRSMDERYFCYVRRLFEKLAEQMDGLYYQTGGPIAAAQMDNEYQHSAAPWEITTGISDEWVPAGSAGNAYMLEIKRIAVESGIIVPFYTCTGWGGAAAPVEEMLPLWGGYAFWPWIFYSHKGEHPVTPEYIYRDFHNNAIPQTYNFEPFYQPESMPYACCEMGGGMSSSYHYRFALPFESVDAMANVKLASGCNLLGYYMFKGGTNPTGEKTPYLNEGQMPRLSYDYQAAIGEFGQIRPSYKRLKRLHLLVNTWQDSLCKMKTCLPQDAEEIAPEDVDTLRFAVRYHEGSGFLFINNYQDHVVTKKKEACTICVELPERELEISGLSLAAGENAVLPFGMDLGGIRLLYATAQPLTVIKDADRVTYFFFAPEGMTPRYVFDSRTIDGDMDTFSITGSAGEIRIVTLSAKQSLDFYEINRDGKKIAVLAAGALLDDGKKLSMESEHDEETIYIWPEQAIAFSDEWEPTEKMGIFSGMKRCAAKKELSVSVKQVGPSRYTVAVPENYMDGLKEALLSITYEGDIAHLFIDGVMIADDFCNGKPWETGLKLFESSLKEHNLTLYITPLKEDSKVNVESSMAGRKEEFGRVISKIADIKLKPVYEFYIGTVS